MSSFGQIHGRRCWSEKTSRRNVGTPHLLWGEGKKTRSLESWEDLFSIRGGGGGKKKGKITDRTVRDPPPAPSKEREKKMGKEEKEVFCPESGEWKR